MEDRIAALERHLIAVEKTVNVLRASFGQTPLELLSPGTATSTTTATTTIRRSEPQRSNLRGICLVNHDLPAAALEDVRKIVKEIANEDIVNDVQSAKVLIFLVFSPGGRTNFKPNKITSVRKSNQMVYVLVITAGTVPVFPQDEVVAIAKKCYSWATDDSFVAVNRSDPQTKESIDNMKKELNNPAASNIQCSAIGCTLNAAFKCGYCKISAYCSDSCARQDWSTGHNQECRHE